jgi:hypothetical protein
MERKHFKGRKGKILSSQERVEAGKPRHLGG